MVKTYDAKKQAISFGGIPITGFAKDSFITVSASAETFAHTIGCDGGATRSLSADRSAKVKLVLMASSPSNDVLSGFHAADILKNAGVVPFIHKDISGSTVCTAAEAYITKWPDDSRGAEVGNVDWEIYLVEAAMFIGGIA